MLKGKKVWNLLRECEWILLILQGNFDYKKVLFE